ncbi:beta-lactamase superfamily domain-containing protein [Thermothelomyces heterothallicus CBS 202.75]|uniref:beta-lactamase superfamily domain-containing protein n=1 Tax=Thermothelomyces heterothallicus CBS 202.75 TaxID=1149848 RepID=UPI0037435292
MLKLDRITRSKSATKLPEHHVASAGTAEAASGWASYVPSWSPSPGRSRPSLSEAKGAGFRNPWPSWHRPTLAETWNSFRWGEDGDGCVELAASHLPDRAGADADDDPTQPQDPPKSMRPSFADAREGPDSAGAKAARLLRVETPDFSFPPGTKAKTTWLGHAGVLVQLPPLDDAKLGRPVRALFDPLFGDRCSPSQFAGPVRSYPPPCRVQDLPPIDLVLISHNHFDHMDAGSILSVRDHSRDSARFFVPLGNAKYLLGWGIPADRVVELDWWDSADFTCVHCTPAQHNSSRSFGDTNTALWSSWLLELSPATHHHHHQHHHRHQQERQQQPYRVFFAGDTGYQFHPDPSWPPSPSNPGLSEHHDDEDEDEEEGEGDEDEEGGRFPACPAFARIRARIGAPHLLLLPVSVGATFSYLRSFFFFFPSFAPGLASPSPSYSRLNPFPRHGAGVTAANHMAPWDAVRVLRAGSGGGGGGDGGDGAVAVAMHWGTFVPDPEEVLRTLGALEWACRRQGVRFARELQRGKGQATAEDAGGRDRGLVFVALHHGAGVVV